MERVICNIESCSEKITGGLFRSYMGMVHKRLEFTLCGKFSSDLGMPELHQLMSDYNTSPVERKLVHIDILI